MIPLTDEEVAVALKDAREKKYYRLLDEEKEARASELRRQLTEKWSYEKTRDFMLWRATRISQNRRLLFDDADGSNAGTVFQLLCYYFSNDPMFVELALSSGFKAPDLRKGICLAGTIGTGKTSLMRLFGVNQRQVFMIRSASEVANKWQAEGEDGMSGLYTTHMLPVNDADNFYHRFAGLCLDDCGAEEVKNHYGNRKNVIGDLIEARYFNRACGTMLHMTSNLTTDQLKEFYGPRVSSRLRECMNVIELKGKDRRK